MADFSTPWAVAQRAERIAVGEPHTVGSIVITPVADGDTVLYSIESTSPDVLLTREQMREIVRAIVDVAQVEAPDWGDAA